jgi:hypothetical protein
MAKAYALLGYDAGLVTPTEAEALKNAGTALPAPFAVSAAAPSVATIQAGGHTLGIVRFPTEPKPGEPIPDDLATHTAQAAETLHGRVDLVVGLSGWGMADEEAFLGAHPGAVDVLLGSGPGSGLAGVAAGAGKTLWARSYTKGKTLNRLDLFALPGAPGFLWNPKTGYKPDVISLDDRFPTDPEVQQLF